MKCIISALLVGAFLISTVSPATAQSGLGGLYFGGEIGRDNYKVVYDDGVTRFDGLGADGLLGGLFAGYDLAVDRWHLAAEGQLGVSTADLSVSVDNPDFAVSGTDEAETTYGAAVRYGYEIKKGILVYLRTGWLKTKFSSSLGTSEKLAALQLGGGVEMALSDHLSLRAEYRYADYEKDASGLLSSQQDLFTLGFTFRP